MKSFDEANRVASELKELIEQGLSEKRIRYYHYLIGKIELGKENLNTAIDNFKNSLTLIPSQYSEYPKFTQNDHALFMDSLALAYFKAGELEKAREEYERIQSLNIGRIIYGDIFANSFYMLGKIYEQQGDTAKAIEHYEKFLDLWKDADPGIAELEDAKKRLAGLKE
jgi:tetratricopeptide (TPR) repeat protein